ncbi:hypothetical protein, partial [Hymenobacter lapidiphilus]|uniref:hypothetical protein n=1 Tax=Hymenobacter sp. CCM 8763 TaxID=2303334 RepID=UPI0018F87173
WLKKSDLAVTFLDRYGNPIGSRGIKHNDSIPLEDFPDNLIKAELYERYSTFMDRFYVGRWKRWVFIEPLSEAATLGLGGMILMLTLAIPAFRETADEDWLKKSDLAVTFLDRYGNPIGSRGIKHNDSIPLEDFPDNLIKA